PSLLFLRSVQPPAPHPSPTRRSSDLLLVFVLCVAALADLLRRPAPAFVSAGKRTKSFWLAVLGIATAVAFVAIPWPVGIGALALDRKSTRLNSSHVESSYGGVLLNRK